MKKNWLDLATDPKNHREELTHVHGNLAADGYRLHLDNTLPACTCEFCTERAPLVIDQARKQGNTVVTITAAALVTACKQAIAIGKDRDRPRYDFIPTLKLSVNGSLQYSATSEENGSVSGEWKTTQFEITRNLGFPVVSSYKLGKGYKQTFYTVKVEYTHEGRDLEFGINPRYLLDALSGMGETVTLKINVRNSPLYVTDGTHEAVIMPVCS